MEDEQEPQAPARRILAWLLIAAGAAGGLWLASLPLDRMVPEPRARRALVPEPPPVPSVPGETAPAAVEPEPPAAPVPEAEAIDPPALTPSAEWSDREPVAEEAAVSGDEALRARLERQLAMNDLAGVRVEIVGERVVTSGRLPRPGDRHRVALLVRSLAPGYVHEDRTQDVGAP